MLYRDLLYWLAGRMCVRARGAPDGIEKPQLSLELGTVRFILFTDDASADICCPNAQCEVNGDGTRYVLPFAAGLGVTRIWVHIFHMSKAYRTGIS